MTAPRYRMRRNKTDRIAKWIIIGVIALSVICGVIVFAQNDIGSWFADNPQPTAVSAPGQVTTPEVNIPDSNKTGSVLPTTIVPTVDPDLLSDAWVASYATPAPSKALQTAEGQQNYLILGSDMRPDEGIYRTDVILLVSLNPNTGHVSMMSFPRDLFVYIPAGKTMGRINTAYSLGGFQSLAQTLEYNFGVKVDHYVMTTFNGFRSLINSLGGIDVEVSREFSDECLLVFPECPDGYLTLEPGTYHMNGQFALWYASTRMSTSDIDRTRRAQEVIRAIYKKLLSMDALMHAPAMYKLYRNNVETDVSLNDITPLIPLANKITDLDNVKGYTMGENEVSNYTDPYTGAMVLLPNYDNIHKLLMEVFMIQ